MLRCRNELIMGFLFGMGEETALRFRLLPVDQFANIGEHMMSWVGCRTGAAAVWGREGQGRERGAGWGRAGQGGAGQGRAVWGIARQGRSEGVKVIPVRSK